MNCSTPGLSVHHQLLEFMKAIYDNHKPTANIILNGENLNAFPLRAGTDKDVHSCHITQHSSRTTSHGHQRGKKYIKSATYKPSKLWAFKDANHVSLFTSGVHCHWHAFSTSGCAFVYFILYSTVYSTAVQYLYFKPRISVKDTCSLEEKLWPI